MATDPVPPASQASQSLKLAIGNHATLADGSRLTYVQLINDSRCPPNVQCVWAGNAEIQMRWAPAGSSNGREFSLNTSSMGNKPTFVDVGPYEIHLSALERSDAPSATFDIKPRTP